MQNFWANEENVTRLLELNEAGLSASEISRGLGGAVSRNSVIGKLNRLGVRLMGKSDGHPTRPRTINKRVPHAQPHLAKEPAAPVVEEDPVILEDGNHVTILTVTDRMCRWPIGDPAEADFHFCGRAPKSGAPYCEAHARKAYQPKMSASANKASSERADTRNMRRVG